ncbi:NADPH-dependent FMN reductase [Rhodococcus spongiicola]|uniref:NAD(P)H-dependent oxidoreductase n=1 Tax=Rhodococcus spongiicola TaxID=2487352 RepID=A0A438ARY5_9NOCA|nr:NAD(P)H-dependent oxidoreductase [Rhodococcus spongiicola]RVW01461.1 NAD(P)H-dependent oxidoreductase [Rhodococcus spongiicola]
MSDLKIAVILGSTRPGRNGKAVADWVVERTKGRADATYELVDLADFPLPHLDEPIPAIMGQYQHAHTQEWAAKIDGYDGFVFIIGEYNHSMPGVLKNAVDYLQAEWHDKAAALVGYGGGGGARGVEHMRGVLSEVRIAHVQQSMAFSMHTDFENFTTFRPADLHLDYLGRMLDQLESWGRALRTARVRNELAA